MELKTDENVGKVCAFILTPPRASILKALCHYALAEQESNLKCSIRFRNCRDLFNFLVGLGEASFWKLKGNIMSNPSTYLSNLRCVSLKLDQEIEISEISCRLGTFYFWYH